MLKPWTLTVGLIALGCATPLAAELNVPIAVRVVSFIQPSPTGVVTAAILYDPGDTASEGEAASIERAVGSGLSVGRSIIRTRRVPVLAMGMLSGYRVAFVTVGLRAEQDSIATAANRSSVLTISSDRSCVQSGHCVVGVTASPKVQITVNRAAARAANIRFGSAFLMLIKEI
ncbi:YfiR/HmsC family protein [Sphingomonas sp. PsM26]|nr:YfiR/HmsC family protein [Sphingomonas sp. PsM26]